MGFPTSIADEVLVRCGRHCCICGEFVGSKIELHHIVQVADGGDNSVDNCIPLCFNCHAEVKSYNPKHPKGRMYTPTELKGHRDKCYKKYEFADNMTKMDVDETEKTIFASNKSDVAVAWGVCGTRPNVLLKWLKNPRLYDRIDGIFDVSLSKLQSRKQAQKGNPLMVKN